MPSFKKKCIDLIPAALTSRALGAISDIHFPKTIQHAINFAYAKIANLNMDEAESPLQDYNSLNALFTRKLKPNARTLENADIISPVDGKLSGFGRAQQGSVIEAKKQHFTLEQLIGTSAQADWLNDAYYFIIYLSPRNYHRIHAPATGTITHLSYVPGRLLPVNRLGLTMVDDLFPTNERLTTLMLDKKQRHLAIVKVGATCVGRITTTYNTLTTNDAHKRHPLCEALPEPVHVQAGDEIATFNLGSTIVLLLQGKNFHPNPALTLNQPITLGTALGAYHT
ncbi:MAG: archaetidylserine decarboxylase [Proteobacteria bacterium]|nr:archaetidylserine decarboxylase [Pseudomonadota bacterium]